MIHDNTTDSNPKFLRHPLDFLRGVRHTGCMRTCLGLLFLFAVLTETVLTVVYHTCVNSGIRFEQKESNSEFINTRRSYRPQSVSQLAPPDLRLHDPADHARF